MSDVIHRTNRINGELERRFSINTPEYQPPKSSDWIITNPGNVLILLEGIVDPRYWETVGDTVVEMSTLDKAAVDAAELAAHNTATESAIKERLQPPLPLSGLTTAVSVLGLVITVDINSIVVNDQTTVVADLALTKTVKVCYVYDSTLDNFSVVVFEKTDGIYNTLAETEYIAADFGEWSVVANGVDLVAV